MSRENVEIVRNTLEAFERGDRETTLHFLDPAFEMVELPLHPETGTYKGAQASEESVERWRGSFEDFRGEPEEFLDAGDQVVAVVRERGRPRGGGVYLDHRYGAVFTLRNGKIVRLEWYGDKAEALEALDAKEKARPES